MLTIPNLITACRIALTPFVIHAILAGHYTRALLLALLAGASDGADGFFARRFHSTSRAGAYLDPIADKLLLTSVYLSLGWSHLAPPWVVGLVIGRDLLILAMVGIAFAFTSFRDFPPSTSGKVSTAIQILTAVVILASQTAAGSSWKPAVRPLIWLTAAAAIYSGVDYVSRAILTLRDKTDRRSENPCP